MALSKEIAKEIADEIITHQIGVHRLSQGVAKKVSDLLGESENDIVSALREWAIEKVIEGKVIPQRRQELQRLLGSIRKLNKMVYAKAAESLRADMLAIGASEASFIRKTLASNLKTSLGEFILPTQAQLAAAVTSYPFEGRLLKEWVEGLEAARFDRLRSAIRVGYVEGEGIEDLVKRIRGTRALQYKDGILETSRRSATAMARTAIQHIQAQAKALTYAKNKDVLSGWQFIATLERNTCPICAALHGKVFAIGEGPLPPRHINCRCTASPVLKGLEVIAYSKPNFDDWLRQQSEAVQDAVLGKTRADLWRSGAFKLDNFVDNERIYTLNELRQKDPAAFLDAKGKLQDRGYSAGAFIVEGGDLDGTLMAFNIEDVKKGLAEGLPVWYKGEVITIPVPKSGQTGRPPNDKERNYWESPLSKEHFPTLNNYGYRVSAEESFAYNCAADACGDTERWWWPSSGSVWPEEARLGNKVDSFDALFLSGRYAKGEITESLAPESGFVKIALFGQYTDDPSQAWPSHLMRQLPTGEWISKMGGAERLVVDNVHDVEGRTYGKLVKVYKVPYLDWLGLKDYGEE